jgi:uncharacterized protein YjbJ (UPF0337 family)
VAASPVGALGAIMHVGRSLSDGVRPNLGGGPTRDPCPGNSDGMSADDTAKNRSRQVKGKAKEVTGKATGNKKLERSGQKDMVAGEIKERLT